MNPVLLSPDQISVFGFLKENILCDERVLWVGGTCLSVQHLEHRKSEDFDIFVQDANHVVPLARDLLKTVGSTWPVAEKFVLRGAATFFIKGVKIQIVSDESIQPDWVLTAADGVRFASLPALALMKWRAIASRGDMKDLYDLYSMDQHVHLAEAAKAAENMNTNASTMAWGLNDAMFSCKASIEAPAWHIDPAGWHGDIQRMELFVKHWLCHFIGRDFYRLDGPGTRER